MDSLHPLLLLLAAAAHSHSPIQYAYDVDGNLLSAQYSAGSLTYNYDPSGNLEKQTSTLTFPEGSIQGHKVSWVQDPYLQRKMTHSPKIPLNDPARGEKILWAVALAEVY